MIIMAPDDATLSTLQGAIAPTALQPAGSPG
jgi:hypothetical protein